MKLNLLFIFLLFGPFLFAQNFTEVPQAPDFDGVRSGSLAFSDVDGDGDQDVLITGGNFSNGSVELIAKLYTNEGGSFTEAVGTPFDGVWQASLAFSDVDGDGDQDVLITGQNGSLELIAKLYTNEGGSFTEAVGNSFDGVSSGSLAFSDVDGDGDQDVLITGRNVSSERIAKLYTNEGGSFTEAVGTPFDGVSSGSLAFSDVDGDGDEDLLITGQNDSEELIAKLYSNEGGSFTEVVGTPFDGVRSSSLAFSDVDGDGDEDLLITGHNFSEELIAKLYTNEGGSFTEAVGTPFDGVASGSLAFSDVDGDGDQDLLITGGNFSNGSVELIAKLYINEGGSFTEAVGTPFDGVVASSLAFSDVDGDGDEDVLITGQNVSEEPISKLYTNEGGSFIKATGTPFVGVGSGSLAFSDVDGDGDEDVLITGDNGLGAQIAKLYTNQGDSFMEAVGTPFDGVVYGSLAFSDVDGDGDEDVLITGLNFSEGRTSKLYTNQGGSFTEAVGTPFDGVAYGSVAFSDVDGDGDNDVLITGYTGSGGPISKLYTNEGGSFTEAMGTPFVGVLRGSLAFSDVDGDGDEDVLITGENAFGQPISKLYTNEGGSFTEATGTSFDEVEASSLAFSDVDGDGDEDVLITGQNASEERIAKLYTNEGGSFTEVVSTPFDGVAGSSLAFSDVDGDGDNDVLITGWKSSGELIAKLYTNEGGSFMEVMGTPFIGVWFGSLAFSDVDGDGDQDVLITGDNASGVPTAKLYTNDGVVSSIDDLVSLNSLDFTLYPNPTKANSLNVWYDARENGLIRVKVFDLNGRLLIQQQRHAGMGQQTFLMNIASLAKGSYILQLDDGKRKGVHKFLVQ